jgi:hypothetical protein
MKDNEQIKNEDEISLIDLFAVLLRYRKLIVGITLTLIILSVVGYFIYPVQKYNSAIKNRPVEGRIIISVKQSMLSYMTKNPEYFINRADVILDSLREAGMDKFEYAGKMSVSLTDEAERTRALYLINQIFILNKNLDGKDNKDSDRIFQVITNTTKNPDTGKYVETVVKDNYSIEVFYKDKSPELIRSFLQNLIIHGNEIAGEYIRSLGETVVINYEQIINGTHTGLSWEGAIGGNLFYYAFIKDFLEGKETILTALGEPVITMPDISLSSFQKKLFKMSIILVFAGFFLSIVLAFGLNAIRNIKNDEEAMKKIRDAMGNSGEK